MQQVGATAVLVEDDGRIIGAVAVRDELRPEAAEVIDRLRGSGYRVAMLTGDNSATATALAAEAGIVDVHAELRPEDKARLVADLRTEREDLRHLPQALDHARTIMLQNCAAPRRSIGDDRSLRSASRVPGAERSPAVRAGDDAAPDCDMYDLAIRGERLWCSSGGSALVPRCTVIAGVHGAVGGDAHETPVVGPRDQL